MQPAQRVTGSNPGHRARSTAIVWRFDREWETGLRLGKVQAQSNQDVGGVRSAILGSWQELTWMLAYLPSERQTFRLQWARQSANSEVASLPLQHAPGRGVMLQYILNFGDHGAHNY